MSTQFNCQEKFLFHAIQFQYKYSHCPHIVKYQNGSISNNSV